MFIFVINSVENPQLREAATRWQTVWKTAEKTYKSIEKNENIEN